MQDNKIRTRIGYSGYLVNEQFPFVDKHFIPKIPTTDKEKIEFIFCPKEFHKDFWNNIMNKHFHKHLLRLVNFNLLNKFGDLLLKKHTYIAKSDHWHGCGHTYGKNGIVKTDGFSGQGLHVRIRYPF